jgi:hypothetical protein
MDLYRIVVIRKGWPVWDGESPVGPLLTKPLLLRASLEDIEQVMKEHREFLASLPSLGRVRNLVPSEDELAKEISLRTEYIVRTEWEKSEMLTWFNQTFASKLKAINPGLIIVAKATKI